MVVKLKFVNVDLIMVKIASLFSKKFLFLCKTIQRNLCPLLIDYFLTIADEVIFFDPNIRVIESVLGPNYYVIVPEG